MRQVICCISLLATGAFLVGCGQSGTLHLPSDPNYDKRAKYLMYRDAADQKEKGQHDQAEEVPASSASEPASSP